jgi:hypothetical protein
MCFFPFRSSNFECFAAYQPVCWSNVEYHDKLERGAAQNGSSTLSADLAEIHGASNQSLNPAACRHYRYQLDTFLFIKSFVLACAKISSLGLPPRRCSLASSSAKTGDTTTVVNANNETTMILMSINLEFSTFQVLSTIMFLVFRAQGLNCHVTKKPRLTTSPSPKYIQRTRVSRAPEHPGESPRPRVRSTHQLFDVLRRDPANKFLDVSLLQ